MSNKNKDARAMGMSNAEMNAFQSGSRGSHLTSV